MAEKTVVVCDWNGCSEEATKPDGAATPTDWGLLTDGDETDRHLCPAHADAAAGWCCEGVSVGDHLDVEHSNLGHDFESANVHAGTHGISVLPFIDEPPADFPEYDPPLGAEEQEVEAWGIHVFDHLHVLLIGSHKDEPRVVVQSDEFPTRLEIDDVENSFERDEPAAETESAVSGGES